MMITDKMIEAAVNAVSENVDWVAALAGSSYSDARQVMLDAIKAALSAQVQDVATVTRESALKAISHVNGNNGRGRRGEAVAMLAAATADKLGDAE